MPKNTARRRRGSCGLLILPLVLVAIVAIPPARAQHAVAPFAGGGSESGEGAPALSVPAKPLAVTVDPAGNVYFYDAQFSSIRRVDAETNLITTLAGGDAPIGRCEKIVADPAGNIYLCQSFDNVIRRIDALTGSITTVAGTGIATGSIDGPGGDPADDLGDAGPSTAATFNNPRGIWVGGTGDLYIADSGNNRIRRVQAGTGVITTIAGDGSPGFGGMGDGAPAVQARLAHPQDVAVSTDGDVFIADPWDQRVRRVDAVTGLISTYAGGGNGADGAPAAEARLYGPASLALDAAGNLFVADVDDYRIRRIDAETTIIETVVGNRRQTHSIDGPGGDPTDDLGDGGPATDATLGSWIVIAATSAGELLIADLANSRVRRTDSTGLIGTVAGGDVTRYVGDGRPAVQAVLASPRGIARLADGTILIADAGQNRIRQVASDGTIQTLAGTGQPGFSGDGRPAASAQLNGPSGVAADADGNVYIADTANHRIRVIDHDTGRIATLAGTGQQTGPDNLGDAGPADEATFNQPWALALGNSGDLYIADRGNHRVRRIAMADLVIQTVAGNGTATDSIDGDGGDPADDLGEGGPAVEASLNDPLGIGFDGDGNLLIADTGNHLVRRVNADGTIVSIAGAGVGTDGGPALSARLHSPTALALGPNGDLYISEISGRIRRVDSATGVISTAVPKPVTEPAFGEGYGLAADNTAGLYFSDGGNGIVLISPNQPPVARAGEDLAVLQNAPVTLSAADSTDPDGIETIAGYKWDLDAADGVDPATPDAVGQTPQVSFPTPGVFEVTLQVTDDRGISSTDTVKVTVQAGGSATPSPTPSPQPTPEATPVPSGPADIIVFRDNVIDAGSALPPLCGTCGPVGVMSYLLTLFGWIALHARATRRRRSGRCRR